MNRWLKTIVGLKFALLLLIVAAQQGWVRIGELQLRAAGPEEPNPSTEEVPQSNEPVVSEAAASEPKAAAEDYLQNLLELPTLSVEGLKKEELIDYLQKAKTAKEQVDGRVKELEDHVRLLHQLEESIEKKLAKIDEEKVFMAASEQREKQVQNDRLTTIIELYEKMDPKKAGPLLEKMDKDLVVALFQKLKKKQVTKFLETMSEPKAVEITEYFGRLSSLREYDLLKEMNRSLKDEFAVCKGGPRAVSENEPEASAAATPTQGEVPGQATPEPQTESTPPESSSAPSEATPPAAEAVAVPKSV